MQMSHVHLVQEKYNQGFQNGYPLLSPAVTSLSVELQ